MSATIKDAHDTNRASKLICGDGSAIHTQQANACSNIIRGGPIAGKSASWKHRSRILAMNASARSMLSRAM
jgi:hypothetical protein